MKWMKISKHVRVQFDTAWVTIEVTETNFRDRKAVRSVVLEYKEAAALVREFLDWRLDK